MSVTCFSDKLNAVWHPTVKEPLFLHKIIYKANHAWMDTRTKQFTLKSAAMLSWLPFSFTLPTSGKRTIANPHDPLSSQSGLCQLSLPPPRHRCRLPIATTTGISALCGEIVSQSQNGFHCTHSIEPIFWLLDSNVLMKKRSSKEEKKRKIKEYKNKRERGKWQFCNFHMQACGSGWSWCLVSSKNEAICCDLSASPLLTALTATVIAAAVSALLLLPLLLLLLN